MKNILNINLSKIYLTALVIFLSSCKHYESSPSIWYFNMSDNYINNIESSWNGHAFYKMDVKRTPGSRYSFNLILTDPSDFFGPVHIQWENAQGKLLKKDFILTKDQFPNTKHHNFDQVFIFFTQDDMELYVEGQREKEKQVVNKNWYKTKQLEREYDIVCSQGEPIDLVIIQQNPLSPEECAKKMPIYKASNMPRVNEYRKLYDAYESQPVKTIESIKRGVKSN